MKRKYADLATRIADVIQTHRPGEATPERERILTYLRRNPRFRNTILPTLEKQFPWLWDRPATEDDFHAFCEHEKITVITKEGAPAAVFVVFPYEGAMHNFIFLNPVKLPGSMLRFAMFHEVAHYLLHIPSYSRIYGETADNRTVARQHFEADVTSALLF